LNDPQARRCQVFQRLKQLLAARAQSRAFDPHSEQRVLQFSKSIFAVQRSTTSEKVLGVHNVSAQPQIIQLDQAWRTARDLITLQPVKCTETGDLTLRPYQVVWLI
jgi:hypothetical protein